MADAAASAASAADAVGFPAEAPRAAHHAATANGWFWAVDGVASREAAGAEADLALTEVDDLARQYNQHLSGLVDVHPNVHLVDLQGAFDEVAVQGLPVGSDTLGTGRWGGFVTLDGLHFSDTGYGFVANLFLDAIDAALGTATARVDLEAIHLADPRSPAALVAAGFDATACRF